VDIGENTIQANVVFFEKLEGGEVQFGTLQKGVPATARLRTWAAGFEWTEDMEEWDNTWSFELVNQASVVPTTSSSTTSTCLQSSCTTTTLTPFRLPGSEQDRR
jgi:hypothetical protein